MNLKLILTLLARVLVIASLKAADQPTAPKPDGEPESSSANAPVKKEDEKAADKTPNPLKEQKRQKKIEHNEHVALKGANTEFLNSPQGITFKKQIASLDQEVNAVYEKYLNVCKESQAKMLREERDRLLQSLAQKRKNLEDDYEKVRDSSPEYLAMVKKHEKSRLSKFGKNPLSEKKGEDK